MTKEVEKVLKNAKALYVDDSIDRSDYSVYKWKLYIHTIPKEISDYDYDKYYVGVTSRQCKERWGSTGNGYTKSDQSYFYNAIQKYGWDNMQHEVLISELSMEEVSYLEIYFIKELNTYKDVKWNNDGSHGYNAAPGGFNEFKACSHEDICGKEFGNVIVNKFLREEIAHGQNVYFYDCTCKLCGQHTEFHDVFLRTTMRPELLCCDECREQLVFERRMERYVSPNTFELIDENSLKITDKKGNSFLVDAEHEELLRKCYCTVVYKKGVVSRIRCRRSFINKSKQINLENLLFDSDNFIIFFNGDHSDYRKSNLYFTDEGTCYAYHHMINKINSNSIESYCIRKIQNGKYRVLKRIKQKHFNKNIDKRFNTLEEATKFRNEIFHEYYGDIPPFKKLLDEYFPI